MLRRSQLRTDENGESWIDYYDYPYLHMQRKQNHTHAWLVMINDYHELYYTEWPEKSRDTLASWLKDTETPYRTIHLVTIEPTDFAGVAHDQYSHSDRFTSRDMRQMLDLSRRF